MELPSLALRDVTNTSLCSTKAMQSCTPACGSNHNDKHFGQSQNRVQLLIGKWLLTGLKAEDISFEKEAVEVYDNANYSIWYSGEVNILASILDCQGFILMVLIPDFIQIRRNRLRSNVEISGNLILLEGSVQDISLDICMLSAVNKGSFSNNTNVFESCIPAKTDNIFQIETEAENVTPTEESLVLSRVQVSYLIGHKGQRIEFLRSEASVNIKIMPIEKRLSNFDLKNPRNTTQEVRIYGRLQNVHRCIVLIEQHLRMLSVPRPRDNRFF
ncbi:Mer1 [Kluyveromyces lactis]|nr:Mer1 [Kluyveromyces lactis]